MISRHRLCGHNSASFMPAHPQLFFLHPLRPSVLSQEFPQNSAVTSSIAGQFMPLPRGYSTSILQTLTECHLRDLTFVYACVVAGNLLMPSRSRDFWYFRLATTCSAAPNDPCDIDRIEYACVLKPRRLVQVSCAAGTTSLILSRGQVPMLVQRQLSRDRKYPLPCPFTWIFQDGGGISAAKSRHVNGLTINIGVAGTFITCMSGKVLYGICHLFGEITKYITFSKQNRIFTNSIYLVSWIPSIHPSIRSTYAPRNQSLPRTSSLSGQ